MTRPPRRVLFLCTHNSARSQMAEGWLRALGGGGFAAFSAGTVATAVRPEAVAAMAELGIDLSSHGSKTLDAFVGQPFDAVVTVCDAANDACPTFPGAHERLHWSIADPAAVEGGEAERMAAFRAARDAIRERIEAVLLGG